MTTTNITHVEFNRLVSNRQHAAQDVALVVPNEYTRDLIKTALKLNLRRRRFQRIMLGDVGVIRCVLDVKLKQWQHEHGNGSKKIPNMFEVTKTLLPMYHAVIYKRHMESTSSDADKTIVTLSVLRSWLATRVGKHISLFSSDTHDHTRRRIYSYNGKTKLKVQRYNEKTTDVVSTDVSNLLEFYIGRTAVRRDHVFRVHERHVVFGGHLLIPPRPVTLKKHYKQVLKNILRDMLPTTLSSIVAGYL